MAKNKLIAQFGKNPTGKRLERIEQSPNFRHGQFRNLEKTPQLTEGYTMFGVMRKMLFEQNPKRLPNIAIPSVKSDLKSFAADENILVWFGHSSYFLQIDGKRILVDPVLSTNASPVPGTNKSFEGTNIYTTEDIPNIDYLFISHDHYDHLDYATVVKLKPKIGKIICGLGVGSHFEYWGFDASKIIENDWQEKID
ncbi:MAG TPA: MBL fold metallo-hydrolase, partial [Chitinophagales bacterium]